MKALICKHLYLLLSFFILSSKCFAAELPNVPPKHDCVFNFVETETHISPPKIAVTNLTAGGPYALTGSNVIVFVSGSVDLVTTGKHERIGTPTPLFCTFVYPAGYSEYPAGTICGKPNPYAATCYTNDVSPDLYKYEWTLSPGGFGDNGAGMSFSATNVVSTQGVYTLTADFTGISSKCGACTCGASGTTNCTVYLLIATNTPWLGLDRRDEGELVKTGGGEAFLDPNDNPTYTWSHDGVCMLENYYGKTVKYSTQDKEKCSKNFLDQKLEVKADITSPKPFSLSTATNFTVVKIEVAFEGTSEETEEKVPVWVQYVEDSPDGTLSYEGMWCMTNVLITCTPTNLPYGEIVTIDVPLNFLYEKTENGDYIPASSSYEASEVSLKKFYVHGHAETNFTIRVTHPTSQAKDQVNVTVSANPSEEECEDCPSCSEQTTVKNRSIYFAQSFGRTPWVAGAPVGAFRVHEKISTDRLGSPAMFRYDHPVSRRVLNRHDATGYISILDSQGRQVSYNNGSPTNGFSGKDMQCVIGADGLIVETLPDMTRIVYGADKAVLKLITPEGVTVMASDLGIDVVRNSDGIRQVWSKTDGLLDVVCPPYSHETVVAWYSPSAVLQQKDASGLYTFTGSPAKTFTFRRTTQTYYKWVSGPKCPICAEGNQTLAACGCGSVYTLTGMMYGLTLDERRGTEFLFQYEWKFDRYDNDWTFTKGSGDDFISDRLIHVRTPGTSTVTRVRSDATGKISTHDRKVYLNDQYGMRLIGSSTVGSDGQETQSYSAAPVTNGALVGRVASDVNAYGASTSYEHDGYGRVITESTTVAGGIAQVTGYGYSEALDAQGFIDRRPTSVVEYQNGVLTSCTDYSYKGAFAVNGSGVLGLCDTVTRRDPTNGVSLRSYTHYYSATSANAIERGRIRLTVNPYGSATHYAYAGATNSWTETVTQGYFDASVAGASSLDQLFSVLPNKSTRTVNTHDFRGDVVRTDSYVHTGGGFSQSGWETYTYNIMHKRLGTTRHDGTSELSNWICTGPVWQRNADGTTVTNTFDSAKRIKTSTRYTPFGNVTTTYNYDADGRIASQTIATNGVTVGCGIGCGATYSEFDTQGRTILSVDAQGRTNRTSYSADNRTITHTDPAGAVVVESYSTDGSLLSRTGNVMRAEYYTHGVDAATGTRWERTDYGSPTGADYTKSYYNALGQLVLQERPGFGGATLKTVRVYNSKGQLETETRQVEGGTGMYDLPVTTYVYNQLGDRTSTTQTSGDISRVQSSDSAFVYENGIVRQTSISVQSCSDATISAMTNSAITRLYPLENGLLAESRQRDVRGNETEQKVVQDPATYVQTTTVSNATSVLPAISTSLAGVTLSSTDQHGCTTTYGYDALMRQISDESRSGPNNERLTGTYTHYNVIGQVEYIEDAFGARTVYGYEPGTGRRISTTHYGQGVDPAITTYTAFDAANRTLATWGATYPVAYEYDTAGRMTAMYTYRGTNAIASNLDIVALKPEMDRTQWLYDQPTGLLTNKLYADGKGPSYSYTALGQLQTRKWARLDSTGQQLLSHYAYNDFSSLTNTAYSDGTPSVAFTVDAIGRIKVAQTFLSASGEIISSTTNIYSGLDLVAEIQNGVRIDRQVDSFGRPKGLALGTDCSVEYGFDKYGRFGGVTSKVNNVVNNWQYSYLPGSHLIASVDHPSYSARKTYENSRNLITTVSNTFGTATISAFGYENDGFGRRTARVDITPTLTVNNAFGYNLKSEVTSATMGENHYGYEYDPIGNRIYTAFNAETNTYSANALNQYSSITNNLPSYDLQPKYDLDGNMLTNGVWSYSWDAENRLTAVYSNDTLLVSNIYDHQSRCIGKHVYHGGTETQRNSFVWHSWNLVQETIHNSQLTITNSYTWGLDLSGTLQGAGGVGGLLAVNRDSAAYFPCFDANGNVTEYIDASGTIRAHYAFDSFGNTITQNGDMADTFSHRFSTKYLDEETGLYYYGYRYYLTGLGRWLNRDLIEEDGGVNVYGFVENEALTYFDVLGLSKLDDNLEVAGWAIGGVKSFQRSLSPSLFWNMSGGANLINLLNGEILNVAREVKFRKGTFNTEEKGGEFDTSNGMVFLDKEGSDDVSVAHELIHSYRLRKNGWLKYKMGFEEGVAHLSRIYHTGAFGFKMFERNYLSSDAVKDKLVFERGIGLMWNRYWSSINFKDPKYTYPYYGNKPFQGQHWTAFSSTFSIKISCQQLIKEYNLLLEMKGKTCLRLTCAEIKEGKNDVPVGFKLPSEFE